MKKINKNIKKKTSLIVTIVTMALLVLIVGISYAVYQKEDEVTFINAKVGDFRVNLSNITSTSTNNRVDLSYTASGYNASTTCTFGTVKGTYNIGATTVNNSKCTKTGLTQNTAYYYKVCTKNNLKQEVCKEGSISTKYNPPTLSAITATSKASTIDLSYTESGTITSRSCKYSTTNGSYTINGNSQTSTKCSITGLREGVTYYYKICVSNNGGENCKTGNTTTKLNPPTLSNITATSTYNSIDLSYTMSGTVNSRTCKYGTTNGNYSYTVSNPTNSKCSLTGLVENTTFYYQVCGSNSGGQNCKTGSINTGIRLSTVVELGDYIKMTPTSTSYSIPTSVTGYDRNQIINPSELNLWRVIKLNSDGTVEMVSDTVSSAKVYFYGKEGYKNLVGGLNTIASQYTNSKYVRSTRHIGYSNQTEKITDTSKLGQTTPPPWKKSTNSSWTATSSGFTETEEAQGAGDIGYTTDYQLVNAVYGNMMGKDPSGIGIDYWLASRRFMYKSNSDWGIEGRFVTSFGNIASNTLLIRNSAYNSYGYGIRPILTLKSNIEKLSGHGTKSSPYILN